MAKDHRKSLRGLFASPEWGAVLMVALIVIANWIGGKPSGYIDLWLVTAALMLGLAWQRWAERKELDEIRGAVERIAGELHARGVTAEGSN